MINKKIKITVLFILVLMIGIISSSFLYKKEEENTFPEIWKYLGVLKHIHQTIQPKTYLEIGVDKGKSINLSEPTTKAIGIDPVISEDTVLNDNVIFYLMTSDEFFANKEIIEKEFAQDKVDMTFIDGMHLFEFVLRDFINSEKVSTPNSIIIIHDTIPVSKEISVRKTDWDGFEPWTGDVYKIVPILQKYRPDLKLDIIKTNPSGLCIVSNLDPNSNVLEENYETILKEYENYDFDKIVKYFEKNIKLKSEKFSEVEKVLAKINKKK